MLKAGVVIDNWKLPIFKEHLTKGKYTFEEFPGLTPDSMLLQVHTNSVVELEPVVRAANEEAARRKKEFVKC